MALIIFIRRVLSLRPAILVIFSSCYLCRRFRLYFAFSRADLEGQMVQTTNAQKEITLISVNTPKSKPNEALLSGPLVKLKNNKTITIINEGKKALSHNFWAGDRFIL